MTRQGSHLGLPQYLNYARLVAPGVIENKDGALLTSFECRGPDQDYTDYDTMAAMAAHLNQELVQLSNGWMIEGNAMRVPIALTPTATHCPDKTSAMIAAERAQKYAEGEHFETKYVLTLTYLPPSETRRKFSEYFFEGRTKSKQSSRGELLRQFVADTEEITGALRREHYLRRLEDDELVHFLRFCVTGENWAVGYEGDRLDYAVGSVPVSPHDGEVGELHTRVIGVIGYPEKGTTPQMFAGMLHFPFPWRMAQRFIFSDTMGAVKELTDKKNDFLQLNEWHPKRILWTMFNRRATAGPSDDAVDFNDDADRQKESIKRAITEVQEGRVRAGRYSMNVVLHDPDPDVVQARALEVVAHIRQLGFSPLIERASDHAADALGSTWPGHGTRGVRRPHFTTRHFANLWLTSQPWTGEKVHSCPYYPPNSGPLLICKSTGNAPYYLNTHVQDLGNFLVVGPSGAGKTFLLNSLAIAHLQYPMAQVNFFDLDAGAVVPTLACGGSYYDLSALRYAPLVHIDEENEMDWAQRFCEKLATLRDFKMTPLARVDIRNALHALSTAPIAYRTVTGFLGQLQTQEAGLKEALSFYADGLLDGEYTPHQDGHWWVTYDMKEVLSRGPEISNPVLMCQIHAMQRRLDGRPTMALFEEGWMAASDELLQQYIEESSATNRKQNCALGLVIHNPGSLAAFARRDLLLTNIATMIFLPDNKAMSEGPEGLKQHYAALGLNGRQIRILAEDMQPKRHYMIKQGKKCRVVELDSEQMEKAMLSVNGRDHKARVLALHEQYGDGWFPEWLEGQRHNNLAEQWRTWGALKEAA